MRIHALVRALPALGVALAGCIDGARARARQYEAMVAAVSRDGSERAPAELDPGSLAVDGQLDRAAVVAAVLVRNPDLAAARAAWRAAVLAYPSVVALEDPMVRYALAPFSIAGSAAFGQRVEVSQRLPWPGRRMLRGDAAIADAAAAQADIEALRLDLAEAAVQAFDDLYLAARAGEINQHHRELLERIERSAMAQYTAGRASQQDPLEARARILGLDRERLMLEAQQRAAVALLNRLLHRRPEAELPPPPARLATAASTVASSAASSTPGTAPSGAQQPHPRQLAATARARARQAEVEDATRARYPSFELMASYDSMWDMWQHRWMIGIGVEIPLSRERRAADVERARAEQAKAAAELSTVSDMLDEARARARAEVNESRQALALYEQQLVPTSRQRVDAALAGFTAGQNPFAMAVMAEHELRDVELAAERTRAELDRRLAALDRLDGCLPGGAR